MHWMRAATVVFAFFMLAGGGQALASEAEITNSSENLRTGWYPEASGITPQVVSGGTFGQLWSAPVEGQVYAQPLLADGTLLVATEKNKVYGLNPATGAVNWSKGLGEPWNPAEIGCGDLTPEVGVTATPVVDPATGIAYLTHKTYAPHSSEVRWYMDALSVATGAEQPGFPVELSGVAQNAHGQRFEAQTELQRPGLLLLEGVVYAGFGSDCDIQPYQGWVFGVSESGAVKARWTSETEGSGSGIWQSGAGIMSDGPGTMLVSTGNGGVPNDPTLGSEPPGNLGESIVRLHVQPNGELKAVDFFAPFNAAELSSWDADFASGGVTGLPNEYFGTASTPHLAVAVGKDGYVYLLNRDNLGGIGEGEGGVDNVVQQIGPYGGVWSRPGVWPGEGGWVYIPTASAGTTAAGSSGNLRVYQYGVSGTGSPTLSLQGTSTEAFGFSSSAPVITSEETTPGSALVWIIWAPNGSGVGAQLRAYNPRPEHEQPVLRWSAPIGTSAKFAIPGVGAGRLYVGTRDGHVLAFGSPITPVLTGPATVFPTTTIGESSLRTAKLTANEPLTVSTLASSSSQFTLGTPSIALPAKLTTGQTLEVPVTFSPTSDGPLGATLTATTSSGKTASFSLSGTGLAAVAELEATPTVVTFGATAVGESVSAGATFRNIGGAPLTIESVSLPEAPFEAEGAPKVHSKIEPGQSVTVTVKFAPSKVGAFNGEIALGTSAGTGVIRLSGSAGLPGELQIINETNGFGQVAIGSQAAKTFSVENIGGTTVTVTKSKPPSGGAFAARTSLPEGTTIAPGEKLTEEVVFTPKATGLTEDAWVINGTGTSGLIEVHFSGVGTSAPVVKTVAASSVTKTSATLNGSVNPEGEAASACFFEYGTSPSYGSTVACSKLPGSGGIAVGVSAPIESLELGTTYYFRLVATNDTGTSAGTPESWTTEAAAPMVETTPASLIGKAGATLNAMVNPNGSAITDCHFDYGPSESYGSVVPCSARPAKGDTGVAVSAPIESLLANSTYYYRVVASNSVGTTSGSAKQFMTTAVAPTVETEAAASVGETTATLNATVDPNGEVVSDCHFEYGATTSYGSSAPCAELPGASDAAVAVSSAIGSLNPETSYYFRIVATNGTGTRYGPAREVTTANQGPTVSTGGASAIGQTAATLNATVDPHDHAVSDCHFEYGATSSFGSSASCSTAPGSGGGAAATSAPVGGLSPATAYDYRIAATTPAGTSYGVAQSFMTLPSISLTQQMPGLGVSPFEVAEAAAITHIRLSSSSLSAGGAGMIEAKVSCPTGVTRCIGTITLRTLTAVPASGPSHGKSPRATILTLARGSFTLVGGHTTIVKLHLSARGRELLARKRVLRATAIIVAQGAAATAHTTQTIVTIRPAKPKQARKG